MEEWMTVLFVSHGAPTLLIEDDPAKGAMERLGRDLPKPKAILCVSAHWETDAPAVSAATRPETIHDFYGFPEELYRLRYPAPGAPELARRVADLIGAAEDPDQGLDHGAWCPLSLMYPEADVPVAQLAIQHARGPAHHVALGRALRPLREEGVMILASGSATHNLRALAWQGGSTPDWAREFDDWLDTTLRAGAVDDLVDYRSQAPHGAMAHPRDEHLLPIHVAAGAGGKARAVYRGFSKGALSMAAYAFD
jgi:4,5-DOPA dioxygenase extradiol